MAFKTFSSGRVTLSLSIILPCLALSAILELALKNAAPKRPEEWNNLVARDVGILGWPQKMFPNEDGLLNASAVLALVITFVLSLLAIHTSRKGPIGTTKLRFTILFILGLNLVLALASFLFSFIQSRLSARVDDECIGRLYQDSLSGDNSLFNPDKFIYEKGTFTSEMWSCGTDGFFADGNNGEMGKSCTMHMGARWLTSTTLLFSGGLFAVIFLDSRRDGHILHSSKSFYPA